MRRWGRLRINYELSIINYEFDGNTDFTDLHVFACKSISDWKNSYAEICQKCIKREDCCGLFSTSKKSFEGLNAFKP